MDISRIQLRTHSGIYLPPETYYTSEKLPEEWFRIIKENKEFAVRPDSAYGSREWCG